MGEVAKEDVLNPSVIESRIFEGRFDVAKVALEKAITQDTFNSARYLLQSAAERPTMYSVGGKRIVRQRSDLGLRNLGGKNMHVSYSLHQEARPTADNNNLARRGDWGDEAIVLEVEFQHPLTRSSSAVPVARLIPASIEWAEVGEDGNIQWELINGLEDIDRLQIIRQMIDTVGYEL